MYNEIVYILDFVMKAVKGIALTYGLFGRDLAMARLIATLVIGLIARYTTLYLTKKGFLDNQILRDYQDKSGKNMAIGEDIEAKLEKRELLGL